MTELKRIYRGGVSPRGTVVFVHGLTGHWRASWQAIGDDPESFWPGWLQDDLPDIAVHSVSYEAEVTGWRGNAMEIPDQAINMRAELEAQELHRQPLVFVCHSLGGLVVKDMLFHAAITRTGAADALLASVQGVVFIATPHSGSRLANWAAAPGMFGRRSKAVIGLETDSAELQRQSQWYRSQAPSHGIESLVFFEGQKTHGIRVVERASADPGLADVVPIPIPADHISICKPSTRSATLYMSIVAFLKQCFDQEPGEIRPDAPEETAPPGATQRAEYERQGRGAIDGVNARYDRGSLDVAMLSPSERRGRFIDQLKVVLAPSPDAMKAVADAIDATCDPASDEGAQILAEALVDLTIETATASLRKAFRQLRDESKVAGARTVCHVTRLVLPAIFEPDILAAVEAGRHDVKAALLALPITTRTVAECVMAAVDGRAARHRGADKGEEFTGGEFELPMPPEGGPQSFGDRFEQAFHQHLINQFTDLEHRRRMPPEILQRRVATRLRNSAEDGKTYYYIFSLEPHEVDDPEIRATVGRLKEAYRSIVFLELSNDQLLYLQETEQMDRVRDQLGTD